MDNRAAWEAEHRRRDWGRWPSECVVRYVMTKYGNIDKSHRWQKRILDIGCGGGATTWFLLEEGFSVTAIDFSQSAINLTRQRIGHLWRFSSRLELRLCDFVNDRLPAREGYFDCALDVACLQCLSIDQYDKAIAAAKSYLKPDGLMFSKHLAATNHDQSVSGPGDIFPRASDTLKRVFNRHGFDARTYNESYWRPSLSGPGFVPTDHWLIEARRR